MNYKMRLLIQSGFVPSMHNAELDIQCTSSIHIKNCINVNITGVKCTNKLFYLFLQCFEKKINYDTAYVENEIYIRSNQCRED